MFWKWTWKWNVQQVQEVRQVLHFPSVLHLPARKGKNGIINNISSHLCKTLSKGELAAIRVISCVWLIASAWWATQYFFWSYSQEFRAVLSLQGNLSVLVVRLYQGLREVQGLPWCPPSLMDQKVPALQVDLGVRGGRARPWGRSLLMDPRRRQMGRKGKRTCCDVIHLILFTSSVMRKLCIMIFKTHLRSNDSRRPRWTHFTLETLQE